VGGQSTLFGPCVVLDCIEGQQQRGASGERRGLCVREGECVCVRGGGEKSGECGRAVHTSLHLFCTPLPPPLSGGSISNREEAQLSAVLLAALMKQQPPSPPQHPPSPPQHLLSLTHTLSHSHTLTHPLPPPL
jgi:hypothetical protein